MVDSLVSSTAVQNKPLDRNKSIVWARDLLEIKDWFVLSTKTTPTVREATNSEEGAKELISLAAYGSDKKPIFDVLLKPDGSVGTHDMQYHGVDHSALYKAVEFEQVYGFLKRLCSERKVLSWNLHSTKDRLNSLIRRYKHAELPINGYSVREYYAQFIGELDPESNAYREKSLPGGSCADTVGTIPASECRRVLDLLQDMASSSQSINSAETFNPKWSASFFKPTSSASSKIKSFFGID